MKENVDKLIERKDNLTDLSGKMDALHQGAAQFDNLSEILKNKNRSWYQNYKTLLIIFGIAIGLIIAVIGKFLDHN